MQEIMNIVPYFPLSDLKRVCADVPMVLCANKIDAEDRKVNVDQMTSTLPFSEISVRAVYKGAIFDTAR